MNQSQSVGIKGLFWFIATGMIYGYARVSTDGQSVGAQMRQLTKAGCKTVFRAVASGAKDRPWQLRRLRGQLEAGDVLTMTRLDPPRRPA